MNDHRAWFRTTAVALFACSLAAPIAHADTPDELAIAGEAIAATDDLIAELRAQQPEGPVRRGFDIGLAATNDDTLWGPGKQATRDALDPAEVSGFDNAVSFALERNRNLALATTGGTIAAADAVVGQARAGGANARYRLGFDIATGIFGNPALGARGNTATGPGSLGIRNALSRAGQDGFNDAVTLHLARKYLPAAVVHPTETPPIYTGPPLTPKAPPASTMPPVSNGPFTLPPKPHACTLWSAAGRIDLVQNNGFSISFTLFQDGTRVTGKAQYPGVIGGVEGIMRDKEFSVTVYWTNGTSGRYDAYVQESGLSFQSGSTVGSFVGGTTFDLLNNRSSAAWTSNKALTCIQR